MSKPVENPLDRYWITERNGKRIKRFETVPEPAQMTLPLNDAELAIEIRALEQTRNDRIREARRAEALEGEDDN